MSAAADFGRTPPHWGASTIYADDLEPGRRFDLGRHRVTEAELVSFARDWDPQVFHVDASVAEAGVFAGLIASGIHTLAIFQRLAVEEFWGRLATIAARGMRETRFVRPVRPDDVLQGSLVVETLEVRDPSRSLLTVRGELCGASGPVLEVLFDVYVARRG